MRKSVVFIMGTGHCGSTLLDLIIGSHTSAFSLGEFSRLRVPLSRQPGDTPHICGICDQNCEFWNRKVSIPLLRALFGSVPVLGNPPGRTLRAGFDPYRYLLSRSGGQVIVDSSKNPGWIRNRVRTLRYQPGMDAFLIYLVRDARAVVASYFRKYPERGLETIARHWVEQSKKMESYYQSFPEGRKLKLNYEGLATASAQTVEIVCKFLGIGFEDGMLRFWEPEHHQIFGNGGTKLLIYRYREADRGLSEIEHKMMVSGKQFYKAEYYEEADIGIHLDERWKQELSSTQLKTIELVAGSTNRLMGYR